MSWIKPDLPSIASGGRTKNWKRVLSSDEHNGVVEYVDERFEVQQYAWHHLVCSSKPRPLRYVGSMPRMPYRIILLSNKYVVAHGKSIPFFTHSPVPHIKVRLLKN